MSQLPLPPPPILDTPPLDRWLNLLYRKVNSTTTTPTGGTTLNNVIIEPTTIDADTSYPVVSYLVVSGELTVSGNLMVTG